MMKRSLTLLALILGFAMARGQILPTFSSANDTTWYAIQFKTGGHVLEDKGSNTNLRTANKQNSDAQKWALMGSRDNFRLVSKLGNQVGWNGSFFTSTAATGTALRLIASPNASAADYWEIQRVGASGCMNQYQGTGAGVQLDEWTAGDNNNPLTFLPAEVALPQFSDAAETFYFLQFCQGGGYLADNGVGQTVRTAVVDPVDGQLWKLVGTRDNFQLVSKAGHYAIVSGTGDAARLKTGTEPYAPGFSLHTSANATFTPNWEILANGLSGHNACNQWTGAAIGNEIGFWSPDDVNNPVLFILPDNIAYPDYKVSGATDFRPSDPLTLWYTQPATLGGTANNWMELSLPIGNGQLGASLFGGILKDEIQFNEKTLWTGRSTDNGGSYGSYQNFGSVVAEDLSGLFGFGSDKAVRDYVRALDLNTATATVGYASPDGTVSFQRQYVASAPDQVIAVRYAASAPGAISLRFTLTSGRPGVVATTTYASGEAAFHGRLETVTYDARLRVIPTGGTLTTTADGVEVRNADEVLLLLSAATDFDPYASTYVSATAALPQTVSSRLDAAEAKGWTTLLADHQADFGQYFGRTRLTLDQARNTLPTNALIDAYAGGNGTDEAVQQMLEELYFAYGRYLEISSSRGVDLPSNLQGIWNNSSSAPWNADIHANINVQMNYWPAEPTNLSEMHLPFLNYITNMATQHPEWQSYAKAAGQTVGWTCYTENNIFGGVGSFMHNYVIENAWYATHLWQHYRYTLDRDFLRKAFPTMWGAAQFWLERMKKAADGTYVCPSEYSPEQGPTEDGTAHAQQIARELLLNTRAAIDVLGDEAGLTSADMLRLNDRLRNIDTGLAVENYTGQWGSPHNGIATGQKILREWKTTAYTAGEDGHRHMSHLMCLYPFAQVTPSSPYFEAAVNSLRLRGDASTGWSMGWKINLWARAHDGDHAHTILKTALRHAGSYGTNQYAGGIYYNLYDAHAPFQIDGNFGATAGIAEMLLQSATDTLQILPALPSAWAAGSISGLKAVGNFTVDIAWKDQRATQVDIVSHKGEPLVVACTSIGAAKIYVNDRDAVTTPIDANTVAIEAAAGDKVVVSLDGTYVPTGVKQETAVPFGIAVSGRTLSLTAEGVKQVCAYDLQGRLVARSHRPSVRVPAAAGNVVVVTARLIDGTELTRKVTL